MSDKPVFVYNGYTDLHCPFDGRVFHFPFQKTVRIDDVYCSSPDEYRRNHESDPHPDALLERTYPAKEFTQMVLTRHNQNLLAEHVVWIGDKEPTDNERKRTDDFGKVRKRKQVEEALSERKQALIKGGRPDLDMQIVEWMVELDVFDETYNPRPSQDNSKVVAEALQAIAQASQQQLAGAKK
jgi:hypothetical protein